MKNVIKPQQRQNSNNDKTATTTQQQRHSNNDTATTTQQQRQHSNLATISTMTYYSIIEVTVIDQSLMASYFTDVPAIVAKHGGVYKARTANHEQMEGEPRERPQLRVILEWPSKESVMAFRDSPEYQPYFENRLKGAKTVHILVEGQ